MNQVMFKEGTKVVYPAHGVGEIMGIETQTVSNIQLTAYVVKFHKENMTLRIPVNRAETSGLRSLVTEDEIGKVHKVLKGRAKSSRGMWSRRAKEYENKINSGNIISLAEVVRDLHKNIDDPDRSYSERVIYENALRRLAGEVSAVQEIDVDRATDLLVKTINDNMEKKEAKEIKAVPVPDDEFDSEFDDLDKESFEEEKEEVAA